MQLHQANTSHTAPLSSSHLPMMAAVCIGVFISHFTAGVVNMALPHLAAVFHSDANTVQWITTGYLLAIAALLPVMGKLADRYGSRTIHNLGYIVFGISSVLAACSPNLTLLLITRIMQAAGAAMFQATNMALISVHLPHSHKGRAFGLVSTAVALGGMAGPAVGGLLVEWVNWRSLFIVHMPAAILATWLAYRYIPAVRPKRTITAFDYTGAVLFTIFMLLLITSLTQGSSLGWHPLVMPAAAGFILMALYRCERRHPDPFVPVASLRMPAIRLGLTVSCVSFMLTNAVVSALPFYLLRSALPASTAGLMLSAYPFMLAVSGPLAGYLSDRHGPRKWMLAGISITAACVLILVLNLGYMPAVGISFMLILLGLGMGLTVSPNNSFIMKHTPAGLAGSTGSMIALSRNTGMAVGAAIGISYMNGGLFG